MLYIPIGPPGSGKSTLAQAMLAKSLITPDAIVCPDDFRQILTGDVQDQSANEQVFSICDTIMDSRLSRGLDVFMDATNLTTWNKYINQARIRSQEFVLMLLPFVPLSELMFRQANRGRIIPPEAMTRMMNQYNQVLLELGKSGFNYCLFVEALTGALSG